jgi:predicted negative regulator of RcsB-dependent stress response
VSGSLIEARNRYQGGDVGGSVAIYEMLVRASQSLADVANDLATMARDKKDPVVYRVLGDSLMRQGRLQEALNTYRDALNLL